MGRFSPRHRSDGNTAQLVKFMERIPGATVKVVGDLIDEFDVILGYQSRTFLLEIKNPDSSHGVTVSQSRFRGMWKGHYAVVSTEAEILAEIMEK